ncbi:phage tail length tape measure family protein [Vibrio parahaemolyticus]|uniref:phage tail length tape measure family protein n=1 Tax=Vibrio parahaemolyticus TaxID=670 RepID=UPI00215C3DC3|nr:phage tail length tape measure family protein [Vibrio parahaemolyticus]MCR9713941.1 phage tail length tape measure family protein [Vibrio parahaemolyticus]
MAKQKVADLVATLDAETAQLDKKVSQSQKKLKDYGSQANKAEKDNKGLSHSFKDAAGSASQLPGPLGNIGGQVDGMVGTVKNLGFAWTAVGGSVAVAIGAISAGLPVLAETERRLLQQEQLIKATGYSSGYTAKQLDEMARSVAMATLTSTQEASKAIGVLLTFRSIMNDQNNTFERTVYLAQDMASVMGGDITSAAKQLGKALEMPSTGMSALKESGVSFTQSQIDMVKAMEETGRIADAQAFILNELDNQIGGAAGAEAGGLIGTADTLGQTWEELLETMADKSGSMFVAKTTMEGLINIAKDLKGLIDPEPLVEFNELFKERVELEDRLRNMGDYNDLPSLSFGDTKSDWFNVQRRLQEVTDRMKKLQEEYKQEAMAQKEAQDRAEQAAADRQKQRDEEKAARDKKLKDEQAARDQKRIQDREKRATEAAERERTRDQEQTDAWLVELERRNMSEMELLNAKYMDEAMKLAEKKQNELITEEQFQESLQEIQQFYADQRKEMLQKELEEREEEQKGFWERYYESMQESSANTDELWRQTFDNFTTGFGNAFASAIMDSENAGDAFKNMAKGMAQSMLAALGKIMAQRLVMWALEKTMLKGEAAGEVARVTSEAQSASLLSAIHAYSSTAAIPVVGPVLAPAAAGTALAATQPIAAAATAAASAGFAGAFDNGGYIPAGQWGITGEYGPEITLGPSHIVGRKQTMQMLQQANGGSSSGSGDVIVNINNVPEGYGGTASQSTDESGNDVITVMLQDLRDNGAYTTAFQQRHGLKRQGN